MRLLRYIGSLDALSRARLRFYKSLNIFIRFKRFLPSTFEPLRTNLICKHYNIGIILDIGANNGQFAEQQYILGYSGDIISYEPSIEAHEKLQKRARKFSKWKVEKPIAIGSREGELEFYEYRDSVFNSFLKVKTEFGENKSYLKTRKVTKVEVTTLDRIFSNFTNLASQNFMVKIDTQGYEKEVIEGFSEFIHTISIIKIEIPVKAMYENVTWTFYDTIAYMKSINFHPINFDIEGANNNGIVRTIDMTFLNLTKHEL